MILVLGPPGAGQAALGRLLEDLGVPACAPPELDRAETIPEPLAVILAWGSPETTVAALAAEGVAPGHAVALWEAHLVHALRGASGLPLLGLDVDQMSSSLPRLVEFLAGLGLAVPPETVDAWASTSGQWAGAGPATGTGGDPELAGLTEAIRARLAPVLAAAEGPHETWDAPADLAIGPTSETILAAHRAAHRAALDAVSAWAAAHAAETVAQDAKAAVEREHRELVGPDPMHYRELRRELWRVRDEFAGLLAERAHYRTEWMRADAARLAAEQRVADVLARLDHLEHIRAEHDAVMRSERWRIGGLVLAPFVRLRRRFTRS